MRDHIIVGIHITDRVTNAGEVQALLTQYGGCIRTRIGLHDATGDAAGPSGLILLETIGPTATVEALCDALRKLRGVQVQQMYFSHPEA
ncbi:MAG TPA: hypothetical protein PLU22_01815 [Polyangiaceae bacterium]|nr:hypothetical protein [Polyangiaceae bacterium]